MRSEIPAFAVAEMRSRFAPTAPRRAHGPRRQWYLRCRMAIEWLIALACITMTAPLILAFAAMIKLTSPGPVLYSQTRLGRAGKPFRMHKLRTMAPTAESDTGPVWSTPADPRVTRIGRFLRDTHLDELPQLWNVLRLEMSLIGPRPERPEIVERLERAMSRYRERLLVRPGITGMAQMQLPADFNLQGVRRKLAFDLHYVHRVGPWLDVRILVSTAFYLVSVLATAACRELMKSDRRTVEDHVESIELLEDESFEIGTS